MKPGWEVKKIGDFCTLNTGGTPKRSQPEYFDDGDIKWLVSGDIHKGEIFDCEGRITELGLNSSNARFLPMNSIMIALNGQGKTRGTVAMLRTKATCNQSLVSITPNNASEVLPEYIFANLRGRYEEIRKMTGDTGNDRRGLNMPLIRSIEIPIAPIDEQRRIVAILDTAFEGLDRARANTEANLESAQELFDNVLSSTFDFSDESYDVMNLGLDEVSLDFGRGKSKHRPRNDPSLYDGQYPFIQTGDIRGAKGLLTSFSQSYNEVGLAQSKLWPKGTVCITIAANIAETAVIDFDACFPDSIIGIVSNENCHNHYLEYMLRTFSIELKEAGKGSAQDNINMGTFADRKFPFPEIEKQKSISKKMEGMEEAIEKLKSETQKKLSAIGNLRQSLLQKAFAGELT